MVDEDLMTGGAYYSTLIAINKAGLSVPIYSTGMVVDDTPPKVSFSASLWYQLIPQLDESSGPAFTLHY